MSICKKVPQLHFDRADPTEPEASLSTYKIKSPSQISNSLPEDHNVPSISEILFGDSDHENNSAQNPNRIKPVNSQGCFVRVVKKSEKPGAKPASFQGVNVKDKNLDIDPDDMFDNFGSMFSVRFMSDDEYKKTVEKQGAQQQHLRRELLPEFAKEEVKPKPVKTVIRLKRRTSDHPTNNNSNTTNHNNNANNGEQKTTAQLLKPISTLNTKLPVLGPVETEQSFSRELMNKSRDYRIRKTSREKLLTPLMNGKGKLELKSRDKSQDVIRQNVSQNIIKDNDVSDMYSLNDIRPRSRGNSRILKDLSSSKIVETEMSPKLEDIPKITKQILKDITNYNHKAFKPYFPFENSHRENKENEQRKTETGHIIRLQVPQEEYFTNRETVPTRNLSLPRDFESHTNRSYQEQARTGPKFFVKNAKATLDIPRHPGNVSQRPSYVKEEPSITSRTDNHQQMGNIKTRERKTLTKVVHPPLKLKVKNPTQIKKDIPIPSKGSSRMGVQKNPVLNYVKIVNEIWGKDGKRAISVPKSPKREAYELHNGEISMSPKLNISSLSVSTAPSDSTGKDKPVSSWSKHIHFKINLNPGITMANFYASLIHVMIVQFNHTVTSTLQPLILLDPLSYNVDKSESGTIVAKLVFLQTLTKICFTPFYGYLMDHIGRKPMILLGACVACTGYMLVPYQENVFPGYAISKILVANGGNMMTLAPLNADYIHDSTKGKATAISMAVGSVGQLLGSLFITWMLKKDVSLPHMHMFAGITVISVTLVYSTKIKKGKYFLNKHADSHEKDQQEGEEERERTPSKFTEKAKLALSTLSQNSWLMISVALSILARADYYLVTMVFGLFVKSFDSTDATPEERSASNSLVNSYQNVFFGLEVVGNLVYGFILDRVNTLHIIFPTLIAAMAGYTMGAFADSKDSLLLMALIFFAGTAMPGLLNSASYLAIKNYPHELRGILSSLISVMGVAGYLFLSTVGGYSFDHFGRSSPFVLFVFMLLASMVSIIYIYRRGNLKKKIRLNYVETESTEEKERLDGI